MKQLTMCFKRASEVDEDKTVIFCGDLNLRFKNFESASVVH